MQKAHIGRQERETEGEAEGRSPNSALHMLYCNKPQCGARLGHKYILTSCRRILCIGCGDALKENSRCIFCEDDCRYKRKGNRRIENFLRMDPEIIQKIVHEGLMFGQLQRNMKREETERMERNLDNFRVKYDALSKGLERANRKRSALLDKSKSFNIKLNGLEEENQAFDNRVHHIKNSKLDVEINRVEVQGRQRGRHKANKENNKNSHYNENEIKNESMEREEDYLGGLRKVEKSNRGAGYYGRFGKEPKPGKTPDMNFITFPPKREYFK